jgi:predicted AlkP superfamily phosphohydrolase/phosphomutase
MISGMDTPSDSAEYTYPPELKNEMFENGIAYQIDYSKKSKFWHFFLGGEKKICEEYLSIERKRAEAALYLMVNKQWDLFIVVFNLPDRIQHLAWNHYERSLSLQSSSANGGESAVSEAYRLVDQLVGRLVSKVQDDTHIILVSDHGFCSTEKVIYLNKWLCDQGFLRLKAFSLSSFFKEMGLQVAAKPLDGWLTNFRLGFLRGVLSDQLLRRRLRMPLLAKKNRRSLVDWQNTSAYAGCGYGIYINLKGRTAMGKVPPGGEYEGVRKKIAALLLELEDPHTGERVVSKVYKKEAVYTGENLLYAPDLIIETKDSKYALNDSFNFQRVFEPDYSGTHHPDGFLAIKGPGVKMNHRINSWNLCDVLPTILYLLGQPIPRTLDGQVMLECFEESIQRTHPPLYGP